MKPIQFLGKLYLIPTTLGEMQPEDVLPQTIKRSIDFIDPLFLSRVARLDFVILQMTCCHLSLSFCKS